MIEIQHPNIKIYSSTPDILEDNDKIISVFHRWIQESQDSKKSAVMDELIIDVANYSHVPQGPGIMLIGHDSFYSIEPGPENRMGLLYNRRTKLVETNQEKLVFAIKAVINVKNLLEKEELWESKLKFAMTEFKLELKDRHFTPNTKESFDSLRGDIEAAFNIGLGIKANTSNVTSHYEQGDPRRCFQVSIKIT